MENLSFKYEKPFKIKGDLIARLNGFFNKTREFSIIRRDTENEEVVLEFFVSDIILEKIDSFRLQFKIKGSTLISTELTMHTQNKKINEYNLNNYIRDIYQDILMAENNNEPNLFTIRVYSKTYNSCQIKGEYEINNGYKTLIKPFALFNDRLEPLTEQIIQYDIEVNAVTIEHARSLAINNAKDINALLSILLDVGFELVSSEYRNYIIMEENEFTLKRFRTGFFDTELKLVVKDNLNGLKHINDTEDLNSFISGKISMMRQLEADSGEKSLDHPFLFDATKKPLIEETFKSHKIKKSKKSQGNYCDSILNSRHYHNQEIKIPRAIRNYFRNYSKLDKDKKEAFISCARMYNISQISSKIEPTISISYLICAIETLANYHKTKDPKSNFSSVMINYGENGFDKKLTDYFYGRVRSSHFHSGKFLFNENSINLQTESDFLFNEKFEEFHNFYNIARYVLVNWINKEILDEKN
ncbi:MAG: hypothetical protein RI964_3237 [Pseudomonadota bacterium]